ncbi:MAG: hypothetical protein AB8B74_13915 [Crocinitomicaceae bacterium]
MKFLLLFVMFYISFAGYGQEKDVEIVVSVENDNNGKKLSGATVSVYADGQLITSSTSGGNGKVPTIYIPTGKYYQIFIRKNGFVTKMAELDARIDILEDAPDPLYLKFETALFESIESVDFSFLESTPMTKFDFDSEYYYRFDKEYTDKMLKKLEELKRKIEEKKKEEAKKDKEALKTEADFNAYVEAGNKALKDSKYETAVEQYGLALSLKKDDTDVQGKLKEAQRLLDEQKNNAELDKKYMEKMVAASKSYADDQLQEAINLYTEASAFKPNEKEPKAKIDEIRLKIAEQKANEKKIASLVKAGDLAVAAEGYDEAITKFTEAFGLKSDPQIKEKLDNAIKLKEDLAKSKEAEKLKNEQYNALITNAESLFKDDKLEDAISKFKEASELKPEEVVPQKRIEEINALLKKKKEEEELNEAYQLKMTEAKESFDEKEWESALSLYTAASNLKPIEPEPKERIKEINDIIEKSKNELAEYNKYLEEGDQFASTEAYEEAVSKYEKARSINETDEVTKKIKDALDAMQALSEARNKALKLEAEYANLIKQADKERDEDKLEAAISSYKEASEKKPEEAYPIDEIAKLNVILEKRRVEAEEKAKAEAAYLALIKEADDKFENSEWLEAKGKYDEALLQKADDEYPKSKLKEIELKLAELAKKEADKKAFDLAMAEGQQLIEEKEFAKAISQFEKAKTIFPDETEPQVKIDEVNGILADLKSAAEREAAYQLAITTGNDLRDSKSYENAKIEYTKALSFKEDDPTAIEEIKKIDQILLELANAAELDEKFNALVKAGNDAFEDNGFKDAKEKYNEAIAIKSDDDVLEKIKLCDDKIKELEGLAEAKAAYDALLKVADDLFKEENWNDAIAKYEEAKAIESSDYIVSQIKAANDKLELLKKDEELNAKLASKVTEAKEFEAAKNYEAALNTYKEAYALRPTPEIESSIKTVETKIKELNDLANIEDEYKAKIKLADQDFNAKKYQSAIELYNEAKAIKALDPYPDQQIKLCNSELSLLSKKENKTKFDNIISQADRYFSEQKYDEAITQYELAKLVLPDNSYPVKKIEEIRSIREKIANEAADKLRKENEYKSIVSEGDEKFNSQNFEQAIVKYKAAQKINAFDPYVIEKIKKAKGKLEALNAAKATAQKYQSFIDKADALMKSEKWKEAIADYKNAQIYDLSNTYPKEQIELAQKAIKNDSKVMSENAYQDLLKDAQSKMDAKEYEASLTLYKSAFRQRPSDNIPADKIRELNALIASQNAADNNKSNYNSLISKADNLFEKKEWKKARIYYVDAYNLTNDAYPDKQIKKIDAINNKFSSDQYSKMIKKADEYFNAENYEKAKGLYNRAIKTFTSQNSDYPRSQLKKIKAILNPPSVLAGMNFKPVGEKVNLSESQIQKMFQEAEEASKNKEEVKVLEAGQSADNIKSEWASTELNASHTALDTIMLQKQKIDIKKQNAELLRQNNELVVNDIEENVSNASILEREYGDNVSFRQMQVVDNIDASMARDQSENDNSRENFEKVVNEIQEQLKTETVEQKTDQRNILSTQVNQIETIREEQSNSFSNSDVSRLNTELDVENAGVNIKNQRNKTIWNQEDQVFATMSSKENMEMEQDKAAEYSDVPRQNMEKIVSVTGDDYHASVKSSLKQHNDISNNTNAEVISLKESIVESNRNADIGREKMEKIDEDVSSNIKSARMEQSSLNQLQVELTDESITDLRSDLSDSHKNKTNKLYEDTRTIEDNFREVTNKEVENGMTSNNNMHAAVSLVDGMNKTMANNINKSNQNTNETTDEILINQDLIGNEQKRVKDSNSDKMNLTEDKLISLKDLNVKAITQAVKNELGNQYPEGVTEEVYQQKDEDGYLLSYVIRRVVVKGGEGNVYEKSQMKHGISYTKNGQVITQCAWQDQTEDASLTYH